MTLDSDKTLAARLAAISRKLESINGSTPPDSLERDFSVATQLKRIEDALNAGVLSAHALGAHTDVALTTPVDNSFLRYDLGLSAWLDRTAALSEALTDVTITAPAAANFLRYNGAAWANSAITLADLPSLAEVLALNDLSDTVISFPINNQFLRYNTGLGKWLNANVPIPAVISDLTDVNTSGAIVTNLLVYDGAQWIDQPATFSLLQDYAASPGAGHVLIYSAPFWNSAPLASTLLTDVDQSGRALNDLLAWDGASKWVIKTFASYGAVLANGTVPLTADWNAGDFDITADAFTSNLNLASSQHTNFVATNAAVATALAGGVVYRGQYIDCDFGYNGVFSTDNFIGQRIDFDFTLTAGGMTGPVQVIDVNSTIAGFAQTIPAFDYRITASNAGSTFGGSGASGAFFVQATAGSVGFNALRSEAIASSAAAATADATAGYLGYSSGANTYTGNLIGVRGFTATTTGANGTWGIMGQPATSGAIAQDRRIAIGGVGGHFFANGGSGIFTNAVGVTFKRPADVATTHLNFLTNYGELYVQGQSEFDGTIHLDGDFDHNGTNVGFYGITPVARPAAYTQTYATAARTHAALTAATLTDSSSGTADTTVQATGDATTNDNFADLTAQHNTLLADLTNLKQVVNQILDDLQLNGLLQ